MRLVPVGHALLLFRSCPPVSRRQDKISNDCSISAPILQADFWSRFARRKTHPGKVDFTRSFADFGPL
jgi:hypothetical protein